MTCQTAMRFVLCCLGKWKKVSCRPVCLCVKLLGYFDNLSYSTSPHCKFMSTMCKADLSFWLSDVRIRRIQRLRKAMDLFSLKIVYFDPLTILMCLVYLCWMELTPILRITETQQFKQSLVVSNTACWIIFYDDIS